MISNELLPYVVDLATSTGLRNVRFAETPLAELAFQVVRKRLQTRKKTVIEKLRSPDKERYIVAPSLYQQSSGATVQSSLRSIHATLNESILRSENESGPKVLQLSSLEAALIKERFPGLLIERDVQHSLERTPLLPEIQPVQVPASSGKTLTIQVRGNGAPIPGTRVLILTDVAQKIGYEGVSGKDGTLKLTLRSTDSRFEKIIAVPRAGFWTRVWKDVEASAAVTLDLVPLAIHGFDWGLLATEAASRGQRHGQGIKVAVIDSGVGLHSSLQVSGGKSFILNEAENDWTDHDGHGTHCAGVVAALEAAASVWGYAPAVEIYALRVFGGADGGGYASDIGDAIEWAVQAGCDILSMSFTSETGSSYIRSKIEKAVDAGVLCVAAAGNEGGDVRYPAKFRNVVGVSAIGKTGTFPQDSIHQEALTTVKSSDKQYFFASFSNRGDEIDLCAPGVAVTSTFPTNAFCAWDGTSMACPHIAGIAALVLEASPAIRNATRDATRMGLLLDRLLSLCTDLGMPKSCQGSGFPRLAKLYSP